MQQQGFIDQTNSAGKNYKASTWFEHSQNQTQNDNATTITWKETISGFKSTKLSFCEPQYSGSQVRYLQAAIYPRFNTGLC